MDNSTNSNNSSSESLPIYNSSKKTLYVIVGILATLLLVSVGVILYQQSLLSRDLTNESVPIPIQAPTATSVPTMAPETVIKVATGSAALSEIDKYFKMPSGSPILKICGESWETPTRPHEELCLKFYDWGKVEKTSDGLLVGRNDEDQQQQDEIRKDILSIYQELQDQKYNNWLASSHGVPVSGGRMGTITTYKESAEVKGLSYQYLETKYIWGLDSSKEAQRFSEIYEHLKSYTPPNNFSY